MEAIHAKSARGGKEVELIWAMGGTGGCEGNLQDEYLTKCLDALGNAAGLHLEIRVTDAEGEAARTLECDARTVAEAVGEAMGLALAKQCEASHHYRGVGVADARDGERSAYCNLTLPGRNDWFYELIAKDNPRPRGAIDGMFVELAKAAKLRLLFRVETYDEEAAYLMAVSFGEAAREAFQKRTAVLPE